MNNLLFTTFSQVLTKSVENMKIVSNKRTNISRDVKLNEFNSSKASNKTSAIKNKFASHSWHLSLSQVEMEGKNKEVIKIISSYFYSPTTSKNQRKQSKFSVYSPSTFLISEPYFSSSSNKQNIHLFYYIAGKKTKHNFLIDSSENIRMLSNHVSQLYDKEISLNFTQVHYPYINSSIFAQYLAKNASANTFLHFINAIYRYTGWHGRHLPSHIKGIKVQVSGRLMTERVIPRVTTKSIVFGSLKGNILLDHSKFTTKNHLGAFTIKV